MPLRERAIDRYLARLQADASREAARIQARLDQRAKAFQICLNDFERRFDEQLGRPSADLDDVESAFLKVTGVVEGMDVRLSHCNVKTTLSYGHLYDGYWEFLIDRVWVRADSLETLGAHLNKIGETR